MDEVQVCEACWSEAAELYEDGDGNAVCLDCYLGWGDDGGRDDA